MRRRYGLSAFAAMARGLGWAFRSPKLVALIWLATLLVAAPSSVAIYESIRADVGRSLVHQELRGAMDLGWLSEYGQRAKGIERSLTASALSTAALFDNVEAWFRGDLVIRHRGLAAVGILYLLVWVLLLGGILDHFAAGRRRLVVAPFLSAGGRYFLRFLRLAALSGAVYYLIYRLARQIFPWIERATRDLTVEKSVLLWNLAGAAAVVLMLALTNMVFDYAKIATVVEGRRSMVLAGLRGLRFVARHPFRTLGLYCGLGFLAALLPLAYFHLAPDPSAASVAEVVLAFLVGQLFLAGRLGLRLAFYGGQMALFEASAAGGRLSSVRPS